MTEPVADAAEQPPVTDAAETSVAGGEATVGPRRSTVGRIGGILLKAVSWLVLVVCGVLIIGFVLVPRLTGSTPYTVLTGSMRPSMPPGTTVVVKPIDFADIRVGDVITYQIRSGEPAVVTHRVIGINVTADGVRLETQGDANPSPDQELVREEQVRGKAWYWLPVIGYVTNGVTSDTRTWLAQGLGVALIGYAVVTLVVVAVRGKKRGPKGGAKSDGGDEAGAGSADEASVGESGYVVEPDAGFYPDNATPAGSKADLQSELESELDSSPEPEPEPESGPGARTATELKRGPDKHDGQSPTPL